MKEAVEELLAVAASLTQVLEHICHSSSANWGLAPVVASAKGRLRVARFILNRTDLPPDDPPSNQPAPTKSKRRS